MGLLKGKEKPRKKRFGAEDRAKKWEKVAC